MSRKIVWISVVFFAVAFHAGGWFGTGGTSEVRDEVAFRTGFTLEPEFGIRLGRITTAMAKPFAKSASGDSVPLKGIAKVEVGIYNVVGHGESAARGELSGLELPGWEPVVQVRDGNERIQVLCRVEGDRIRAMLVVVLDAEELVVVRLEGNLQKFLPAAIERAGWSGLHDAVRPGAVPGDVRHLNGGSVSSTLHGSHLHAPNANRQEHTGRTTLGSRPC